MLGMIMQVQDYMAPTVGMILRDNDEQAITNTNIPVASWTDPPVQTV